MDINVENGTRIWVRVRDVYGLAFSYGRTYILQQTVGAEDLNTPTTWYINPQKLKVGQVGGAAYRPNRPQKKVQATIRLLSLRFTFVSSEDAFVLGF